MASEQPQHKPRVDESGGPSSSSIKTQFAASNPATFRDLVKAHLVFLYNAENENQALIVLVKQIVSTTFGIFTLCKKHLRVVRVHSSSELHPQCFLCPADEKEEAIPLAQPMDSSFAPETQAEHVLQRIQVYKKDYEKCHVEHLRLHEEAGKEKEVSSSSHVLKRQLEMAQELATDAWVHYFALVWDLVRPILLQEHFKMCSGEKPAEYYHAFLRLAGEFRDAFHVRHRVPHSRKGSEILCFKHGNVGDLLPLHGFDSYDMSCGVCRLPTYNKLPKPSPPDLSLPVEPADMAE